MVDDGSSTASGKSGKSTARQVGSVVYLALTALFPAAVVINVVNRHWFYFLVAVVATVLLVPLAIAITRQPGPAARLVFPVLVTTAIGILLVGAGLG